MLSRVRARARVRVRARARVRARVSEEDLLELLHVGGSDALPEELDPIESRHLVVREVTADKDLPARGRGQPCMGHGGIRGGDAAATAAATAAAAAAATAAQRARARVCSESEVRPVSTESGVL